MREILFRGKNENTLEWVEGWYYKTYCKTGIQEKGHFKYINVLPETVGEYTGLTDKNSKKIFEGDIVKFGRNIYQIIFECGSFALFDVNGEMITKIGGMNDHCYSLMNLYLECCWEDDCAYDVEIIGNVHDNPELLKGVANETA